MVSRPDPGPLRQNTSLEPWWYRACRDGGPHQGSQEGEARCRCLEGRSTPPATPTRIEGVGCSNRCQPQFIKEFLVKKSREHATLFDRIPWVNDPQAAYLLLLMSGSTRANFLLRAVRPDLTEQFAIRHDSAVWRCLCTILGTPSAPVDAQVLASLSFSSGGLGLASAHRVRTAAHFASWLTV